MRRIVEDIVTIGIFGCVNTDANRGRHCWVHFQCQWRRSTAWLLKNTENIILKKEYARLFRSFQKLMINQCINLRVSGVQIFLSPSIARVRRVNNSSVKAKIWRCRRSLADVQLRLLQGKELMLSLNFTAQITKIHSNLTVWLIGHFRVPEIADGKRVTACSFFFILFTAGWCFSVCFLLSIFLLIYALP